MARLGRSFPVKPVIAKPVTNLFLDSTSPAAVRDSLATTQITYTPADQRLLVAFCHADANNGTTETMTVSSTGGLAWSLAGRANGAPGGDVEVWTAQVTASPGSVTISVTDTQGTVAKSLFLRSFGDVSGVVPAGIGATGISAASTVSLTTTIDRSWLWAAGLGATFGSNAPGTGDTLQDSVVSGGFDGGDNIWTTSKTVPTPTHGTSVTVTDTGPSPVHAVAVEILPAAPVIAASALPAQPIVVGAPAYTPVPIPPVTITRSQSLGNPATTPPIVAGAQPYMPIQIPAVFMTDGNMPDSGFVSGPNYGGSATGLAGGSGVWVNPGNATGIDDDTYATWAVP